MCRAAGCAAKPAAIATAYRAANRAACPAAAGCLPSCVSGKGCRGVLVLPQRLQQRCILRQYPFRSAQISVCKLQQNVHGRRGPPLHTGDTDASRLTVQHCAHPGTELSIMAYCCLSLCGCAAFIDSSSSAANPSCTTPARSNMSDLLLGHPWCEAVLNAASRAHCPQHPSHHAGVPAAPSERHVGVIVMTTSQGLERSSSSRARTGIQRQQPSKCVTVAG